MTQESHYKHFVKCVEQADFALKNLVITSKLDSPYLACDFIILDILENAEKTMEAIREFEEQKYPAGR